MNNLKKKMCDFWVAPEKWQKISRYEKDSHIERSRES